MENPGTVDQEHLGISVYPADVKRGYIGVQVRMATEIWPGTRPESKKLAVVEIVAAYQTISEFSADLLAVLKGSLTEACLKGE